MNTFSPSQVIEDEVGRFDRQERIRMRQIGFEVVPTTSDPIASVTEGIRRLSEGIAQMDGIQNHAILQRMAEQRSRLTMQLPEIGYGGVSFPAMFRSRSDKRAAILLGLSLLAILTILKENNIRIWAMLGGI